MIISTLKKLTIKSFDNYDIPDDFFKRKNLVFGHNGRGKSSLARAIIENIGLFQRRLQMDTVFLIETMYGISSY